MYIYAHIVLWLTLSMANWLKHSHQCWGRWLQGWECQCGALAKKPLTNAVAYSFLGVMDLPCLKKTKITRIYTHLKTTCHYITEKCVSTMSIRQAYKHLHSYNGMWFTAHSEPIFKKNNDCLRHVSLKIWKLEDSSVIQTISHKGDITCVACTEDSEHVVTGSDDMSLKVWETKTGKLTQVGGGADGDAVA